MEGATMTSMFAAAIEKVHSGLGQGSVLEQIDKLYRRQQRTGCCHWSGIKVHQYIKL
jgi:hypothetical protein